MRTERVRKLANRDSESLFVPGRLLDPVEVESWRHGVLANATNARTTSGARCVARRLEVLRRLVRGLEHSSWRLDVLVVVPGDSVVQKVLEDSREEGGAEALDANKGRSP
jgi:hypothetical protein